MANGDKEVLDRMHENWKLAEEAEAYQRELELDDYRFCAPESQWDEQIKTARTSRGLPCETDDQIGNFIRLACNNFAQARPQPKVSPVGDGGDLEVAKIRQGMIRCIMYKSNGDVAIDNAYQQMIRGGVGYARVITVENEDGTLDIKVKRIPNRFSVYFDPYFEEPDGSDANFAFIASDIPRKRFKMEYPKAELADKNWNYTSDGDEKPDWANKDSVRVVEYYERQPYEESYWSDGQNIYTGEVPEGVEPAMQGTRKKYKVMWYKATCNEILESTEWPDEYIPVIPMLGEELILDGHRTWAGLVRSAKDAQKRINYYVSQQIQAIAMAPKAPWIAAADSLINPSDWINDDNQKVLFYKSSINGQPVNPPTRDFGQVDIGSITSAYMQAVESLKATTGMFAPALGMQTGQSGKAIDLLQQQGQSSNGHFIVAAQRFMRHLGRILNSLMFRVYDTPRVVAIIRPDEQTEMVAINQLTQDQKGRPAQYDITGGKYDVTVDIGPSYQTKRQENQANITQLLTGPLGQVMAQIAPDLALGQFDFDMSDEVLERVKRFLAMTNPQLVDEQGQQQQIPPQVMQQMQQLQQALQQLQAQNQELQQGTQAQMAKIQAESQLKAQSAQVDAEVEMQKAQLQAQVDLQKAQLQAETDILIARMKAEADAQIKMMTTMATPQPAQPAVAIAIKPKDDESDDDMESPESEGTED